MKEPRHAIAEPNFELFGIDDDGEARKLNVADIGSAPVMAIIPGRMTREMFTRLSLLHASRASKSSIEDLKTGSTLPALASIVPTWHLEAHR